MTFIVMCISSVFHSTCTSQDLESYGIKSGACAATQSEWFTSVGYRWGFDAGAYAEWKMSDAVSMSTEVHYIQKGVRFIRGVISETGPGWPGGWSPRIDYVALPILVKARLMDAAVSPYLLAGPRADVLVHTDEDGIRNSEFNPLEKTDFGLTIGAGIELHTETAPHLGIEVRYSPSFKEVLGRGSNIRNTSTEILIVVGI